MDYKKIIKSRELRLNLLKLTNFIPDKLMLMIQYRIRMGRKLNLKEPQRFTEKLQWYKLNYRSPLMTKCVDKYSVREYVKSKGYEDILVPIYGVYSKAEDIDFDKLPNSFVLKTTNGSKTNILCEDKDQVEFNYIRKTLNMWLTRSKKLKAGREWPYYNVEPKIISEKYLELDRNNDLIDYKFICFNGKVSCIFINAERYSDDIMRFGIYSRDFEHLPYRRKGLRDTDSSISKPDNYERMLEIAETLSADFPHVRVDLYNINGQIYFGEMTYFHGSGYIDFEPDEFDLILGEQFELPKVCTNSS